MKLPRNNVNPLYFSSQSEKWSHPPPTPIKGKRGRWTWVSEHCSNMSRNSISFSQVAHIVFCCWYCEVETFERDKAAHLFPALWPWVPDRYKSVRAGQHSSEQVNRASSNPSGGPQSAGAQQRLLQMLTFANMNSLAFWKTKLPVSKRVLQMAAPSFLSRQHLLVCGSNQPSAHSLSGKLEGTEPLQWSGPRHDNTPLILPPPSLSVNWNRGPNC